MKKNKIGKWDWEGKRCYFRQSGQGRTPQKSDILSGTWAKWHSDSCEDLVEEYHRYKKVQV